MTNGLLLSIINYYGITVWRQAYDSHAKIIKLTVVCKYI